MSYFNKLRSIPYLFGNENYTTAFQDISTYIDIIDQIKDNANFYTYYEIQEGERPDNLSQKIYGTPDLHWVFFLLNDSLREQGWPLKRQVLDEKIKETFTDTVLTTRSLLTGIFLPGQTISGLSSGKTGLIISRNLDLGQLVIEGSDKGFIAGETITSIVGTSIQNVEITGSVNQYDALIYYVDSDGQPIDVDPAVGESAIYSKVTNTEYYQAQNDALTRIKIIKPTSINSVLRAYFEALRS